MDEQAEPNTPAHMVPTYMEETPQAPVKSGVVIRREAPFDEGNLSPSRQNRIKNAEQCVMESDDLLQVAIEQHLKALTKSYKAKQVATVANQEAQKAELCLLEKKSEEAFQKHNEAANSYSTASANAASAAEEVSAAGEEMYRAQKASLEAKHSLSALKSEGREAWLMQDDGGEVEKMTEVKTMYSIFVSYCKDKNPDYPLMRWMLSERQFARFRKLYVIATELSQKEAMDKIKLHLTESMERLRKEGNFWFDIPKRDVKNLDYCHTMEIPLLRRGPVSHRSFVDGRSKHTSCMTLWLLHHLYKNLERKKFETVREIFYHGKRIFRTPQNAANCLTDICCLLECTSVSLNILPEQKGAISGKLILHMKDGKKVNANSDDGVQIPRDLRDIARIEIDKEVEFALVLEKGTIYNFLRQENFHEKKKCLLMTGYGMADERTRNFVRMLQENNVLLYAIADPDPHGIEIIKTYAKGSVNLAHDNFSLAAVSIHWLGITTLDIESIEREKSKKILNKCSVLTSKETSMLKKLMAPEFLLSPIWHQRILHMLNINRKASFEDLYAFGDDYAANIHIPFLITRVKKNLAKRNGNGFGTKLSFDEVQIKTSNFGLENLIGSGSLGDLYSITLDEGEHVALRKLKIPEYKEKFEKLRVQACTASKFKHENLLQLYDVCIHEDHCLLAYEFAPLGSLHDILHGKYGASGTPLELRQRIKIAFDIAKGLEYLHEKAHPCIIHGEIRPSNILLFENFKAKIAEFHIAKLSPDSYPTQAASAPASAGFSLAKTSIDVSSIINYRAPECCGREPTHRKSDVYSFGLVLSELLTGKKFSVDMLPWSEFLTNSDGSKESSKDLLKGWVDPKLVGQYSSNELDKFIEVIVDCTQQFFFQRPKMSQIVKVLSLLHQESKVIGRQDRLEE